MDISENALQLLSLQFVDIIGFVVEVQTLSGFRYC